MGSVRGQNVASHKPKTRESLVSGSNATGRQYSGRAGICDRGDCGLPSELLKVLETKNTH